MFQFYLIFIFLSSLFFLIYNFTINHKTQRFNLPPGPRSFPVIGHLFSLEPLVYRFYHRISLKYGPIFSLRFGLRRVVVISSYSLFKECFTGENDIVLANRPSFFTNKYIAYNNGTVGTSPYGDHWRNLRRICSLEILSSHRLATFLDIRRDEIRRMLTRLSRDNNTKNEDSFKEVELEPLLSDLTFNNIVRMVTGKRYYGEDVRNKEEADIFKKIIKDISESSSSNQSSNYLPFLKFFGNKFEMKVKEIGVSVDKFLQRLLDECRKNKEGKTMVNHLVSLQAQEPEYYNNVTIKGLMMGLIIPGTDSSSITMGWAMANLLNHPEVMKKAREEIDEKVGQDRLMDEEDLSNLPYLQNIISETFRLFPAAPLLVAREASKDIKIGEYDVPRGTMLLVNAWVIHRDPDLWDDPEKFNPDRFKEYTVITEESFDSVQRLMPFGHGRRSCPASGLARRIITWTVGSLIQCFDWKSIDGGKVDMEESPGLLMRKQENLRVMCRPRPVLSKFLAQANS